LAFYRIYFYTYYTVNELLALYSQKNKYFSTSYFPKKREVLCFNKNNILQLKKLDFKHAKFQYFELQLKKQPPLNRFKRGCFFLFFLDYFLKKGSCASGTLVTSRTSC